MSVVGFDIGTENCVIDVTKKQGIDVLLNDESNREKETPAVDSYGALLMGATGAASATVNIKLTVSQVKRLIGRSFNHPDVQVELRLFPFETSEGRDGGILIHLQYMGQRHTRTTIQVLGMLLWHLKQIAEKSMELVVSDCVIGIPSYFTDLQRRHYLDAAIIAGLNPLRLMNDTTAIAIGYGVSKSNYPSSGGGHRVVFVDIGHSDMQVAVALFEPGQMKILSHAWDSNLGGRDFNEVLFQHFAAQFKQQYGVDVCSNLQASIRLRGACAMLNKVLSIKAEAHLNIERLIDEKDLRGSITRDEFEKLSSSLLERINVPCKKAIISAGLTVEEIYSVELVGSGARIRAITKTLTSFFKREPSTSLNVGENVARGCAIMFNRIFRERRYEVQDSLPFSIGFSSDGCPIQTLPNGVLFPRGHPIPSYQTLTLHKSSTFQLEAFYADQAELPPGVSPKINTFTVNYIGPFQASNPKDVRVKVEFHVNLHGIITALSSEVIDGSIRSSNIDVFPEAEFDFKDLVVSEAEFDFMDILNFSEVGFCIIILVFFSVS
ncbi:hypothetical protein Dimus_035123 [Dionaea muscipula]